MRFEKSNEMIQNCNTIMNNHLQIIGPQLTEGGLQFRIHFFPEFILGVISRIDFFEIEFSLVRL